MNWKNLLESISKSVNEELRLRNEYLVAENRILRNQIDGRVQLTDSERKELAEIGSKLGKKALAEIATVATPDTILAWQRKFADQKVDTAEPSRPVGRPRVDREIEDLAIRMARESRSWGYDRIQGALNHLGYKISDQTVGNILKRHSISPAPERKKTVTWREFIRCHWDVLMATGFFNSEVWSYFGQISAFLLSLIHFVRHPVQSVRRTLHPPNLAMKSLIHQSLELRLQLRRWVHLVARQSHAAPSDETFLDQAGSKFEFTDARQIRSQDMGKVLVLFATHPRPIRDGPIQRHSQMDDPLITDERKVA